MSVPISEFSTSEFPTAEETRAGLDAYNRFLAEIWHSKQKELALRLSALGRQLARERDVVKAVEVLEIGLDTPPILKMTGALDGPGKLKATLAIGEQGGWNLGAQLRVGKGLPSVSRGHLLAIEVEDLRMRLDLEIDRTSGLAAEFLGSEVDVVLGGLSFRANNFFLKIFVALSNFFEEMLKGLVEDVLKKALKGAVPDLGQVRAIVDLGLATEPLPVDVEVPPLADFEAAALDVSRRVLAHHMPFGSVLNTLVPRSDPGAPPAGDRFIRFADSAIWTGHVLAGEVFRHRVKKDAESLAAIDQLLDGFELLTSFTEDSGLLSRVAIGVDDQSLVSHLDAEREQVGDPERLFVSADGRFRSMGHITRDQYAGALLGCGLAALWVEDPTIQAKARSITSGMIRYLDSTSFCPTEVAVDPETGFKMTSVTYALEPTQVLAILQLAKHLSLEVGDGFAELEPVWSIQWFFHWLQTLDPVDSYYKYNLSHGMNFLLLALEEDPERKGRLASGLRVHREALRHHGNAYFDLVELLAFSDRQDLLSKPRAQLEKEALTWLAQAFDRSPFILNADQPPADLETVEMVDLEGRANRVARQARPIIDRPGADFLWQRSPFALQVVWPVPNDPAMRSPNADLSLPYWMARMLQSS